jgi:hypothetical protein
MSLKHRIISVSEHKTILYKSLPLSHNSTENLECLASMVHYLLPQKSKLDYHILNKCPLENHISEPNYSMKYHGPHIMRSANVIPTSKVCNIVMLVLFRTQKQYCLTFDVPVHIKSHINPSCVSKVTSVSNTSTQLVAKSANEC